MLNYITQLLWIEFCFIKQLLYLSLGASYRHFLFVSTELLMPLIVEYDIGQIFDIISLGEIHSKCEIFHENDT